MISERINNKLLVKKIFKKNNSNTKETHFLNMKHKREKSVSKIYIFLPEGVAKNKKFRHL